MITQDHIYDILKHYLKEKGLLAEQEIKMGWNHIHDRIFKEHAHFGLGFAHPIHLPTAIEHIPEAIRNDAMWLEGKGAELWSKITGKANEASTATPPVVTPAPTSSPVATQAPASTPAPDNGPQFNTDDKGDLSFAFQTGVNQVRPTTQDQVLAAEVTTKTDAVSTEIATGETVTAETLAADTASEQKATDDVVTEEAASVTQSTTASTPDVQPTQTVPAEVPSVPASTPAPTPTPTPAPVDDLNIDGA